MALHRWMDKIISHPTHHDELERDAAGYELGATKLDRKNAEEAAYKAYKLREHGKAIAHHLKAMRAAVSSGQHDDADRHAALYDLHMKALDMKPGSMPPPVAAEQSEHEDFRRFKNHPADQMLVASSIKKSEREAFFKFADTGEEVVFMSEPDEDPELSKSLRAPMSIDQLDGRRVKVYFNLHNRLFSVMHGGRVVAHLPELKLNDVKFRVQQAGRRKVLENDRKNVHAYVEGEFEHNPEGYELKGQGVTYNPYKYDSFVRVHDKSPISNAKSAVLKNVPHPTVSVEEDAKPEADPSWIHKKGSHE